MGQCYLRALSSLHGKYMSVALMAVGDPSLLLAAPAAAPAAAPVQPPGSETSEEEDNWDTGEGWEIPDAQAV